MPLMLSARFRARSLPQACCTKPTVSVLFCVMVSSLLRHHALGELHGHAMQATVLVDQRPAGHAHDLPAWEAARQGLEGGRVRRIIISRYQHRAIHDEE